MPARSSSLPGSIQEAVQLAPAWRMLRVDQQPGAGLAQHVLAVDEAECV